MANYTKLFSSIITSTIWQEADTTRLVWITMLAICDKNGEIQASIPGLARVAGVSLEATEAALEKFMAPDKYSRTPHAEGRRIEAISGGWALLNHAKYRFMASKEDELLATAERQRRYRVRNKKYSNGQPSPVTDSNDTVTESNDIADTDADPKTDPEPKADPDPDPKTDTKANTMVFQNKKSKAASASPSSLSKIPKGQTGFQPPTRRELEAEAVRIGLPADQVDSFINHFESNGWKVGGKAKMVSWVHSLATWKTRWLEYSQKKSGKRSNQDAAMKREAEEIKMAQGKAAKPLDPEPPAEDSGKF